MAKQTQEQKRNARAELVCRELRYQIGRPAADMDLSLTVELLTSWMRVAKSNKWIRPTLTKNNRK